ncbi:coproporphyrinogen III oxidase [Arcanobacterium bovis]|uniref:Heme chaperone HemW n=1 Tax=Arcanobacterium bovis TaxID=2529275 RepID=A0A4Q9V1M3_9ACTO|nr:coproporphyrinogen III oxidase [Arcanobacterium bovis]
MAELPLGDPAPADGTLPEPHVGGGFSAYIHVPFCRVRCGYCDFNTYTNLDFGPGASVEDFRHTVRREIELSRRVLDTGEHGALRTVFFGGGTPTMLAAKQLLGIFADLTAAFGLEEGAEVTTEANPETLTKDYLAQLKDAGFTRISCGMQSADPQVLATLDRAHTQGQVEKVATWAQELGLRYSIDLIYGAPGESMEQWERSIEAALELEPAHISAYALTVEPATKMGAQLRRGEIREPDPEELADKYVLADERFSAAGLQWYEISNWAKSGEECQHNMHYWRNANWWGYGPGAHSHINGTRFWNVKHPIAYAQRLNAIDGNLPASPAAGREVLTEVERREEHIMMGVRLSSGIKVPSGTPAHVVANLVSDELIDPHHALSGKIVLTRKGRLLADTVIRELW